MRTLREKKHLRRIYALLMGTEKFTLFPIKCSDGITTTRIVTFFKKKLITKATGVFYRDIMGGNH